MNTMKNTRSSLFLIELILAVLFFSLGSAVCVQAFVKAHMDGETAQDLSFASSTVSSAASVVKYTEKTLESLEVYFPGVVQQEDTFAVYYDSEHNICSEADAAYTLWMQSEHADNVVNTHIWMENEKKELLYELELHYPEASR